MQLSYDAYYIRLSQQDRLWYLDDCYTQSEGKGAAATTLVTPQTGLDGTKAAGQEKDEVESECQARGASCQRCGLSKLLCP